MGEEGRMIPTMTPEEFLAEHIHGDRLADLCDVALNWPGPNRNLVRLGDKPQTVFCKTDYLPEIYTKLANCPHDITLVTHNSDYQITEAQEKLAPKCIKRWFGENADRHGSRIIPIPLGVERPEGRGYSADMKHIAALLSTPKVERNLAFMCHSCSTNPAERNPCSLALYDKPWVMNKPYGTPFVEYLENVRAHRCMICPPGNGPDTHRVWEALYLGTIPVVKRSRMMEEFSRNVPMVLVDSWEDLDEVSLESGIAMVDGLDWGRMDYLRLPYWRKLLCVE
jgi:hypothetical protein